MKFSINAVPLADAAQFAAKAIAARPVNPAMSGILIKAEAVAISLTGSDYDAVSTSTVEADVDRSGSVLVPAGMFTSIIQKMKGRNVNLELDEGRVQISAGASRYVLPDMGAAEFPAQDELPAVTGAVDGQAFADAIGRVIGAVAHEKDGLPVLTGVRIHSEGDRIVMHTTDRYRLAEESVPYEGAEFDALVPGSYLSGIAKTLVGEVSVLADGRRFGIRAGNRESASAILDGDFPKIQALFPNSTPITVTADRAEFLDALDRATVVNERDKPIILDVADDRATITAGEAEQAGVETFDVEANDDINTAFNPAYLRWALANAPGERVTLGFNHPSKPAYITPDDAAPTSRKLVMPVRK